MNKQSWLGSVGVRSIPLMLLAGIVVSSSGGEKISDRALRQIEALQAEKASRSAVHRKLDSQFVFALKRQRGQAIAAGATELRADTVREADGRLLVDIQGAVTAALLDRLAHGGGTVIHSSPRFQSVRAQVRLEQLEELASVPEVRFIRRASTPMTHAGSVNSEGDVSHGASLARSHFGATGRGVKVGVLSDGIYQLVASQASGNLGDVTILPGQAGPFGAEGTAMLEIIHDLAPEAELYFATAYNGQASFAENILNLRSNGCDIIVDDVFYTDEPVFQDGVVAQAIDAVTADGALYFSAAGNDGNSKSDTAGAWEGDFVDSGQTVPIYGGKLHSFGATSQNTVLAASNGADLYWADPIGASTNDYDLYVLSEDGTNVVYASNNAQTGTQDPYEHINYLYPGWQVVIVKSRGAARFLHLQARRGHLKLSTPGAILGHSTATNAISVAAVNAGSSLPNPFSTASTVETFSSDGPRRMFFHADGSPITPGNYSTSGGHVRSKPDIAAADGVTTSISGFEFFSGTSAAAPHAAAVAALVWSFEPSLSAIQLRDTLFNTTLDIEAPGFDANSGAGIVMAERALAALPPKPIIVAGSAVLVDESCPNRALDPGETATVAITLTNVGPSATLNLSATLLNTGGVSFASAPQEYGVLDPQGGTSTRTYQFRVNGNCGDTISAMLQLQDGTKELGLVNFKFRLGATVVRVSERFDSFASPSLPGGWSLFSPPGNPTWRITSSWNDSPPYSIYATATGISDQSLISPRLLVSSTEARLTFRHYRAMSSAYVGGVLEIATNGNVFQDILVAGGTFLTNGYNGSIWFAASNPLEGRSAWTASAESTLTTVSLPPTAAGRSIRLRWRYGSGNASDPSDAWFVDSIVLNDGVACCSTLSNDLIVSATSFPNSVVLGGNVSYELTLRNNGPDNVTGITLTNLLPAGFAPQSMSIPPDVLLNSNESNALGFSIATLAGGETRTITLSGTLHTLGLLTNRVVIARADGGLSSLSNATTATFVTLPQALVNDVTLLEGDTGSSDAIFTVGLTAAPATNSTVRFSTADQTARAGKDYVSTNGVLTFAPGVTNQKFAVRILANQLSEPTKTFVVNLSAPTNLVVYKAHGIGTILNEDPLPYLSISDVTVVKPNVGTTSATFDVGLFPPSGQSVSVSFGTSPGSAIQNLDYTYTNDFLTFAPGQTNLRVSVVVTNHITRRPDQWFALELNGPSNAKLAKSRGIGTILTVVPGRLDHFSWNTIAVQSNGLPFSVTVTARDYFEAPATNPPASAVLSAFAVDAFRTNSVFEGATTIAWWGAAPGSHGYAFMPKTNMWITHFRVYANSDHVVSLWQEDGTLLARESGFLTNGAWVEKRLAAPVLARAGKNYRVSTYFSNDSGTYIYGAPLESADMSLGQQYYSQGHAFPTNVDNYRFAVDFRYLVGMPNPLPLSLTNVVTFAGSSWSGSATVHLPATNVSLMASDAAGHIGISPPFEVIPAAGQITHFAWEPVATLQTLSNSFAATLTALDFFEQLVTNYAGSPALTAAFVTPGLRTNTILGNVTTTSFYSDSDFTFGHAFRAKTNLTVTHFRHYFGDKVSLWTDSGTLLASRPVSSTPGTWKETALLVPVSLLAGQTYRLGAHVAGQHYQRFDLQTNFADVIIKDSYFTFGDVFPASLNNTKWDLVDIRYTAAFQTTISVAITPTNAAGFITGVWSGQMQVNRLATNVVMLADDKLGHKGFSNPFNVVIPPVEFPLSLAPALETGTVNLSWSATPGRAYQIQYSTNLNQAVWLDLIPALTATNGQLFWNLPIEAEPQRFYRVRIMP